MLTRRKSAISAIVQRVVAPLSVNVSPMINALQTNRMKRVEQKATLQAVRARGEIFAPDWNAHLWKRGLWHAALDPEGLVPWKEPPLGLSLAPYF